MRGSYYNEFDPKAAAWLRELIAQGMIADGEVDTRSITDVRADDLRGFTQCHFFAGIGFWSLALRWAGWPDDRPVWTGSCPCQPFSCAGAGKGTADERHLWPVFRDLITACRPPRIFGEQVASAAVVGKVGRGVEAPAVPVWLDGVRADMEAAGYAFGASIVGAHSVGAPHRRQRVYWVADRGASDSTSQRDRRILRIENSEKCADGGGRESEGVRESEKCGDCEPCRPPDAERATGRAGRIADDGRRRDEAAGVGAHAEPRRLGTVGRPPFPPRGGQRADGSAPGRTGHADELREVGGSSDDSGTGLVGRQEQPAREECQAAERSGNVGGTRDAAGDDQQRDWQSGQGVRRQEPVGGSMPWSESIIHRYLDGKDRRIPAEPRLFPLADDRHPYHRGRVGLLRGAGNAITPWLAKEFIEACEEVLNGEAP